LGAERAKFQLFSDSGAVCGGGALPSDPKFLKREAWELPESLLADLTAAGMPFSCTTVLFASGGEMFPHVDSYKIASYELL